MTQFTVDNIVEERATPFYYYDMSLLEATLNKVAKEADQYGYHVHYAMKANSDETLLKTIFDHGLGADCVSGNEMLKALEMGLSPEKIVLAGVGKTDQEITAAIQHNIFSLNIESLHELEVVNTLAKELNQPIRIAFRVNPNVDAKTHKHITTGLKENKFGIAVSDLFKAVEMLEHMPLLHFTGLHCHIGSQIMELAPFEAMCHQMNAILRHLDNMGVALEHLNLGGGLGVNYFNPDMELIPNFKLFFKTIHRTLETNLPIHFELGRSIVGQCGALVTRVLFEKQGGTKNFLIVDAGMTELMRPALYGATHRVEAYGESLDKQMRSYNVVGPVCESTDSFGDDIDLPVCSRGQILLIRTTGAYGASMANHYNLRKLQEPVYYCGTQSVVK